MNQEVSADAVVSSLRQIIRALDLQSKKLTKKYGLTGPQIIVLKEIRKYSNRPISAIARSVSLSQATVTSILDRLEQQEYVERKRNTTDKRKVNLLLTEKAETILKENPSLLHEAFIRNFEELADWEKSMLLASLQRIAALMQAENIHPHTVPANTLL